MLDVHYSFNDFHRLQRYQGQCTNEKLICPGLQAAEQMAQSRPIFPAETPRQLASVWMPSKHLLHKSFQRYMSRCLFILAGERKAHQTSLRYWSPFG